MGLVRVCVCVYVCSAYTYTLQSHQWQCMRRWVNAPRSASRCTRLTYYVRECYVLDVCECEAYAIRIRQQYYCIMCIVVTCLMVVAGCTMQHISGVHWPDEDWYWGMAASLYCRCSGVKCACIYVYVPNARRYAHLNWMGRMDGRGERVSRLLHTENTMQHSQEH